MPQTSEITDNCSSLPSCATESETNLECFVKNCLGTNYTVLTAIKARALYHATFTEQGSSWEILENHELVAICWKRKGSETISTGPCFHCIDQQTVCAPTFHAYKPISSEPKLLFGIQFYNNRDANIFEEVMHNALALECGRKNAPEDTSFSERSVSSTAFSPLSGKPKNADDGSPTTVSQVSNRKTSKSLCSQRFNEVVSDRKNRSRQLLSLKRTKIDRESGNIQEINEKLQKLGISNSCYLSEGEQNKSEACQTVEERNMDNLISNIAPPNSVISVPHRLLPTQVRKDRNQKWYENQQKIPFQYEKTLNLSKCTVSVPSLKDKCMETDNKETESCQPRECYQMNKGSQSSLLRYETRSSMLSPTISTRSKSSRVPQSVIVIADKETATPTGGRNEELCAHSVYETLLKEMRAIVADKVQEGVQSCLRESPFIRQTESFCKCANSD